MDIATFCPVVFSALLVALLPLVPPLVRIAVEDPALRAGFPLLIPPNEGDVADAFFDEDDDLDFLLSFSTFSL